MLNLKDNLYIATFQNDAVAVAKEFGVGLEYNHVCISESLEPDHREALLSEMTADLSACGSQKAVLHGPFTEIYPAAIDYKARLMGMERLNQAYDVCQSLGVNKMVVHNGWLPFIYFKEWQSEKGAIFWQKFMEGKAENFFIYVENVLEDEPYMMLDMMKQIEDPRIKICLDIGHANAITSADTPVEKWIEVLGPHIGHFHLHSNYGDRDTHGDFESGSLDIHRILETIEEHCSGDLTYTIEARECRNCLQWLKKHNYI